METRVMPHAVGIRELFRELCMDLGKSLTVETIAEREFAYRLNLPVPTHGGGWLVSFWDHPEVVILDAGLNEVQRLDLQAQSEGYCSTEVAMSRNGALLALSTRTELRLVDRRGAVLRRLPHHAWDAFTGSRCFFDAQGRLWYVRPRDDDEATESGVLTVLDPASGAAVFEQAIESDVGHFVLSPLPDHAGALIDVACGQDGSFLHLARLTGAGLTIEEYPFDDRIFCGGFSPNGSEFITGTHSGDAVKVHSFPGGQVIASVKGKTIFAGDDLGGQFGDDVGYQAIFLDDDHLLADTRFGRMLLIDRRTMQLIGTVWPPGYELRGYDAGGGLAYEGGLTSLHSAGPGRVLMGYKEKAIRLLDFAPLLSSGDDRG